jgi:hypothetical protein
LANEIKIEQDLGTGPSSSAAEQVKANEAFKAKGWQIEDKPGEEDVALIKQEGNETYASCAAIKGSN